MTENVCILIETSLKSILDVSTGSDNGLSPYKPHDVIIDHDNEILFPCLSGVPDFFDRNKILSGYDLSHYQVPHCIRVFFYFVWFVFIHHNFQFYLKLCTSYNILDIYLS